MSGPILHIVDDSVDNYDVTTTKAAGGTELMYRWMANRVDASLLDQVQVICSRLRKLEDKPRIFWAHDTASDPEVQFMQTDPQKLNLFETIVFVTHWQQQQYAMYLGVPYDKGIVIQHAVEPIPVHEKPKDKIRLLYASTPHRGLALLLSAFEQLDRDDVELEVYSSFDIYDRPEANKQFEALYDKAKSMKNVKYSPSVSNDTIREAMQRCHILAYPSIYPETSCITAIEAMSAGMLCVLPNLAALPETCANFAWMYNFQPDVNKHIQVFSSILNDAIDTFWDDPVQGMLRTQRNYFDLFYSWDTRVHKWNQLLAAIANK